MRAAPGGPAPDPAAGPGASRSETPKESPAPRPSGPPPRRARRGFVNLVCSGSYVEVALQAAKLSPTIKDLFEKNGPHTPLQLDSVTYASLQTVKKYLEDGLFIDGIKGVRKTSEEEESRIRHDFKFPRPLPSASLLECGATDWEWSFIAGIKAKELCDLINTANELQLVPLVELASAKLASDLRGKSAGLRFQMP